MRKLRREVTNTVPLKGPEYPPHRAMIEAHNVTHLPAALWCEICVLARGKVTDTRESNTIARYRVRKWISNTFLVLLFGVPMHMPRQLC